MALIAGNRQESMQNDVPFIVKFAGDCYISTFRSNGVLKNIVGLLGDLADCYSAQAMAPMLHNDVVKKLIQEATQMEDARETALWAKEKIGI